MAKRETFVIGGTLASAPTPAPAPAREVPGEIIVTVAEVADAAATIGNADVVGADDDSLDLKPKKKR